MTTMEKNGLLCSWANSQLEDKERSAEHDTQHLSAGGCKTVISDDSCLLVKVRISKHIMEFINFMELFKGG